MYTCWHKQISKFYACRCILYTHKMALEMCLRKWQKLVFLTKRFKGWTDWKDGKKINILIHILVLNDKNDSWKNPTFQISRHVTGMPSLLTLWLNTVTYKNQCSRTLQSNYKESPSPKFLSLQHVYDFGLGPFIAFLVCFQSLDHGLGTPVK